MKTSGGLSTMIPYPQTSNNSTLQKLASTLSSIQKPIMNNRHEKHHIRTPPVAPQPYDELDAEIQGGMDLLRMKKESTDFDSVMLKMHGKVKSLESKYLDLANFYKRELLAQGGTLHNSRFSALGSQNMLNMSKSKEEIQASSAPPESHSHFDGRKNDSPQRHPYDENIEKTLINDLLKEKKDLEQDLQEMMQLPTAPILNDSDLNVEGRIRDQQSRMQAIESLKQRISDILSSFQDEFLLFINRNYQTFTENDVTDLFSELRLKLDELMEDLSDVPIYFNHNATVKNAIQNFQGEMQEGLKSALADYELSSGYTTQAIKKIAFELQSKHGTAQLDAKKAQISLQSIMKRCNFLQENFYNSTLERSPVHIQQRIGSQSRMGSLIPPMSPSTQINNQQRVVSEIQGHVQILSQTLYSISDKLLSSDDDLRYLVNDVEDEHNQILDKYKQQIDKLLSDLIDFNEVDRTHDLRASHVSHSYQSNLEEINQNLQANLDHAQRELDQLRANNEHLVGVQHPLNRVVSFGLAQQSSTQNSGYLNDNVHQRLADLQSDNDYLTQQIRSLTHQLSEKSQQADRLAHELAVAASSNPSSHQMAAERSRERSKERVNFEQVQFYQKKYDDALRQTRDIVKLTQRFLTAMKRLQKAVHRKEQNVSQEKNDFEEARKELEPRLKDIKREIDQLINPIGYNMGSNSSEHGKIEAQISRYQNKAPHTFSERDRGGGSVMSGSIDQKMFQRGGSEYRNQLATQNNPYGSTIAYEVEVPQRQRSQGSSGHKPLTREKSPIIIRNSRNTASTHGGVQRDLYRSIDTAACGGNLLSSSQKHTASSANKIKSQKSASQLARDESQSKLQQQRTPGKLNQSTTSQSKILRQMDLDYHAQLDAVNEDLKRLRNERDNLLVELQQSQSANHSLQVQAERDLHRERLNREQLETELCRLSEDRETLALQVQALQDQLEMRVSATHSLEEAKQEDDVDLETIKTLRQENHELQTKFETLQTTLHSEADKTRAQIEDIKAQASAQITQLKERSQGKDLEIGQLRENLRTLETQTRTQLQTQISQIQDACELRLQEIDLQLQTKSHEIIKLARQVEKREQSESEILQGLRQQVTQAEEAAGQARTQVAQLTNQLSKAQDTLETLKDAHSQQISTLKNEYQARLEQEKKTQGDILTDAKQSTAQLIREKEVIPLQEQIRGFDNRIKEQSKQEGQLRAIIQDAQTSFSALTEQLKESEIANQELKAFYDSQLQGATSQISNLQQQLKDAQNLMKTLQQNDKEAQLTSHVEWLQGQITSYLGNIEKLNSQAQEFTREKQETVSKCEQKVKDLQKESQVLRKELDTVRGELKSLTDLNQKLTCENEELKLQSQENHQAIGEAEEIVEQVQVENTNNYSYNELQAQVNNLKAEQAQMLLDSQADAEACIQDLRERLLTVEVEHNQALNVINRAHEEALKKHAQESQSYLQTIADFQKKLERLQRECEAANTQSDKLRQQVEQTRSEYQQKVKEYEGLQARYNQALKERDGNLDSTQTELIELQTRISQHEVVKAYLQKQIEDIQNQNNQIIENYRELEAERDELQAANDELAAANQQSELMESQYGEKVRILQERVTAVNQDIEKLQTEANSSRSRALSLEIDLENLKQKNLDLEAAALEAHDALTITQGDLKRLQDAHAFSQQEISRLTQSLSDAGFTIETLKTQVINSEHKESDQLLPLQEELALERQRHLQESSAWEKEVHTLNQALLDAQTASEKLQKEQQAQIQEVKDQLTATQSNFDAQQAAFEQQNNEFQELQTQAQELVSQNETLQGALQELEKRNSSLKREIQGLQEDMQRKDAEIAQLKDEKASLQEQLMELMNQSTIQQSHVTEVLQKQLQAAHDSIQTKSQELSQSVQNLSDLQRAYREQTASLQEAEERAQLAEAAFEQQDQEMQEKSEKLAEMQATFAKNRDLIMMLKEEYKRASDKSGLLEKQIQERSSAFEKEREKAREELTERDYQIEELRGQVKRLKEEFEVKHTEAQNAQVNLLEALNNKTETGGVNSTYVRQIEDEIKQKDELIEEANRFIEEFNDEKHELKAKFKHLMLVLEDPDLRPEDESSYKEDEDIDLNQCFDALEQHLQRSKRRVDQRLQLVAEDNSRLKDELEERDEEVRKTLEEIHRVTAELDSLKGVIGDNDKEMRRQLENAGKKIVKYKQRLADKHAEVDDLNQKILAAQEESKEAEQHEGHNQKVSHQLEQENMMLLTKLQKAEQELQSLRSQTEATRPSKPDSEEHPALDTSFKLDAQRLQQMESQLINLRRQLFEAKDSVIDTLNEHFSKKFRELQKTYVSEQIMRAKLSELNSEQLEQTLNNNVKVVKVVRFVSSMNGNEGPLKKLLIIQVISNNECYVVDEGKLSEGSLSYVRSYLPEALDFDQLHQGESLPLNMRSDFAYQRELGKLEDQVRELREERLELYQELQIYKQKVATRTQQLSLSHSQDMIDNPPGGFADLKGLELEEENVHLNAENLELRQKMKHVIEKNALLQARVLELNELVKELSSEAHVSPSAAEAPSGAASLLKASREENEQLRRQLSAQRHRYQGMLKRHDLQDEEEEDEDFDQNSFLQGIQVAENIGGITPNQDGDNVFDQSSILMGVIEDLSNPPNQPQKTTNPAGNYSEMQQVEKLQKECDELRQRLQQSLNQQNNASSVLMAGGGGDHQATLKHIKGTLLQFLKNCPLTDRNNEELLTIVFSMMEFTKEEIAEVQEYRTLKSKGGNRAQSVSSGGGGMGGTDPGEDEVRKKTSKGIFGMFSRGKSKEPTIAAGKKTSSDKDDSMTTTPTKPLAPIGRR